MDNNSSFDSGAGFDTSFLDGGGDPTTDPLSIDFSQSDPPIDTTGAAPPDPSGFGFDPGALDGPPSGPDATGGFSGPAGNTPATAGDPNTYTDSNGDLVTVAADGTWSSVNLDGTYGYTDAAGNQYVVNADGTWYGWDADGNPISGPAADQPALNGPPEAAPPQAQPKPTAASGGGSGSGGGSSGGGKAPTPNPATTAKPTAKPITLGQIIQALRPLAAGTGTTTTSRPAGPTGGPAGTQNAGLFGGFGGSGSMTLVVLVLVVILLTRRQ